MESNAPSHFEPKAADITVVPQFNRGTAFTDEERQKYRLRGLLPAQVETIEQQAGRSLSQLRSKESSIEKYIYLSQLQHTNETLFYKLLIDNLEEIMPIVYTPTVGEACQKLSHNYRVAQGMYFCPEDKGVMREMLNNWPQDDVDIIVVTDGSRILGLGDLGANGMGIPIGKLSLYVAGAGFDPARTLPVTFDFGTNNESFLKDPEYVGRKERRIGGQEYLDLVDEFMTAVYDKWPKILVQFEDFSNDHAFLLLERYRNKYLCFNDDIQGTGAVILSGFINCLRVAKLDPEKVKLVFMGAGSAGIGVADMIVNFIAEKTNRPAKEVRKQFWFVDSRGLITKNRGDELQDHKVPYARDDNGDQQIKDLKDVVDFVKPNVLIGLCGIGQTFTKEVISSLNENCDRPIIFALSNPTKNAECTAQQAYEWTEGKAIFASGSPFDPVTYKGKTFVPGQGNNMFIFPGLGFASFICGAKEVSDAMIVAASTTLAEFVPDSEIEKGNIYPSIKCIREISTKIVARVINTAKKEGLATVEVPSDNLEEWISKRMYLPVYH